MKKRLLSIILAIVTLFTIIIPISTYAYNEDDPYKYEEPYEFYQTHISIQGHPGWCINGSWYYHNWTGKPINPEIKVWQSYGYYVGSKWVTVKKNLVEQEDYGKSFTNNVDIGYCKVYVYGEPSSKYKYFDFEPIEFDLIELSSYHYFIESGENVSINYTSLPDDVTEADLVYTSSNNDICTVSDSGVITGVGAGSTTIIIKSQDGKYEMSLTVTVSDDYSIEGFEAL